MTTSLASTWATRELPILQSVLRHKDAGKQMVDLHTVSEETGLEWAQVLTGVQALEAASPPYLVAEYIDTAQVGPVRGWVTTVHERARRELGTWPSPESIVDRLVEALSQAADAEEDPVKKGKARAAVDATGGFLRDVMVQAIGTQLGGAGPF